MNVGAFTILTLRRTGCEETLLEPLCTLLTDAVDAGASVGFLAPLARPTAQRYWQQVLAASDDSLHLWIAEQGGEVVGSVQLALCQKENGRHRAEIQKLFVLRRCRGHGVASRLLAAAEADALACGRSLLVLDTEVGSHAETVYRHLGWQRAGEVPCYATTPDGELHATAIYYKRPAG